MSYLPPLLQAVLLIVVVTAAIWDLRVRRIPNWLVLTGLVLGLALNTCLYGFFGAFLSLKGLGLAVLIYLPLYMIRAMGAGDVKLMAAVGAMVGAADWLGIFVCTALAGGSIALALLAWRGRVGRTLWNVTFLISEMLHFRAPYLRREELDVKNPAAVSMPHGSAIAIGAIAFLVAAHTSAPR
jgi:prepilin peptidase CpaA